LVAVACFLPSRAKDLLAPPRMIVRWEMLRQDGWYQTTRAAINRGQTVSSYDVSGKVSYPITGLAMPLDLPGGRGF
jgi:hypothetical protein